MFGPLNQCDHEMVECCDGCGHWSCTKGCGLNWDDGIDCAIDDGFWEDLIEELRNAPEVTDEGPDLPLMF